MSKRYWVIGSKDARRLISDEQVLLDCTGEVSAIRPLETRLRRSRCWSRRMRGRKQDQVSVACLLNVETMIALDHLPKAKVAIGQITELQESGFNLRTLRADRGYCSRGFIEGARARGVIPHPAT